jgi:hypothetical protein
VKIRTVFVATTLAVAGTVVAPAVAAHAKTEPPGGGCNTTAWVKTGTFVSGNYSAPVLVDEEGVISKWVRVDGLSGTSYSRETTSCTTQDAVTYNFQDREELCASPSHHEGCKWDDSWGDHDGLSGDAKISPTATPDAFVEDYYDGIDEQVPVPACHSNCNAL